MKHSLFSIEQTVGPYVIVISTTKSQLASWLSMSSIVSGLASLSLFEANLRPNTLHPR